MTIVDYCGLLWTIVDCHVECMIDSFNALDAHQFLSPRHVSGHTSNRVQQDQERDPFWLKRRSLRKSTETPFQAPFTFSFKIENKHKQTQNGYSAVVKQTVQLFASTEPFQHRPAWMASQARLRAVGFGCIQLMFVDVGVQNLLLFQRCKMENTEKTRDKLANVHCFET